MNYQDIDNANKGIKMLNLKGKDYAMVPERVTAFRKIFPDGFINTEILSHDGTLVLMQCKAGYYDENGTAVILGTGFAQEEKGKGLVNGTSYIENCETSAVGRALGFIGLGLNGGGICSAEELVNAITAQEQTKNKGEAEKLPKPEKVTKPKNEVTVSDKLPVNPVLEYLARERDALRVARDIDKVANNELWTAQLKALTQAKLAPDKPLSEYTQQEAEALISAMYSRFDPKGAVLKHDGKNT